MVKFDMRYLYVHVKYYWVKYDFGPSSFSEFWN